MNTYRIELNDERDTNLTEFGKTTLKDRYLLPGETYQQMFARVASAFADDQEHAQRMYDYISKMWFMPATPVLSNGGTDRGLPISCYLNNVQDDMGDIVNKWNEDIWLGAGGGGIGTCWSKLRSIGEPVRGRGSSSGIIPFVRVLDSLMLAVSQGSLRRGAAAAYLYIGHPEIEEFLEMRKPTGDYNRKSLNLHHGIVICDDFMRAVEHGGTWDLVDPKSKAVKKTLDARELFQRIVEIRLTTGEPYLLFRDTVNNAMVGHQRQLGLEVSQSNLCSEIMLHTGPDHLGRDRTAVCCLGSVNLEKWFEWHDNELFVEDCLRFLDNVLQNFIDQTEGRKGFENARYSAMRERSVGLGAMGLHSFLQANGIPMQGAMAKVHNKRMFAHLRLEADKANLQLALEKGACPDAEEVGVKKRFSHMLAIAPTASISIIAGGCSPCVEPWNTNYFTQKTLSGSVPVKNTALEAVLKSLDKDTPAVWESILENGGSVQHLEFLSETQKAVFQTSFEVDQRALIELAADRSPMIDQGQSINLFLSGTIDKWDLLMLHFSAWERGIKSLYYCRSMSNRRAGFAGGVERDNTLVREKVMVERKDYEECTSCQ